MPTNRFGGAAAVSRSGRRAGTIGSSNGKAGGAPAPRRNVRRGMCFLVMNMMLSSSSLDPEAELRAPDDAEHDRREPVAVLAGVARARAHGRGGRVLEPEAQRAGRHRL